MGAKEVCERGTLLYCIVCETALCDGEKGRWIMVVVVVMPSWDESAVVRQKWRGVGGCERW